MKVLIKGILAHEDAELAVKAGVDGIIVSNHGARSEDSGRWTIDALPEILDAVRGRMPVVDSGFRHAASRRHIMEPVGRFGHIIRGAMRGVLVLVSALVVACSAALSAYTGSPPRVSQRGGVESPTLDIYWIDVEGGAATLVDTPSGESMHVDTGFETDGRDANRIFAAAQKAGLDQLDHVVISHYHGDHVGGLAALSKMISIRRVYSRGDMISVSTDQQWYDSMRTVSAGKRTIVKPRGQDSVEWRRHAGRLLRSPDAGQASERRRPEHALRHRRTESAGRIREPGRRRGAADVQPVHVPRPYRHGLGHRVGARLPAEQGGAVLALGCEWTRRSFTHTR